MNTCRLNKLIASFGCALGLSMIAGTATSVAGPLTIEGDLNVTGNTTVSNLTVNGTNVIDAINAKMDPGNVLRADGSVPISGGLLPFEGTTVIRSTAADGADDSRLYLSGGGGGLDVGRGAVISLSGNEAAGPGGGGKLSLWAGAGSNGVIELHTGVGGNNLGLIIDEDGNVGIGTNTPTVKLEVDGDVKANFYHGDGSRLSGINASPPVTNSTTAEFQRDITVTGTLTVNRQDAVGEGGEIILKRASDNAASWHMDDFYESLRFFKDGEVAMVVTPGGAVGIGTAAPLAKLDVNGDVKMAGQIILVVPAGDLSMGDFVN